MAKKNAAPKTRCEEGGDELLPFEVPFGTAEPVKVTLFVCKANANVRAWIEELPIGQPKLLWQGGSVAGGRVR